MEIVAETWQEGSVVNSGVTRDATPYGMSGYGNHSPSGWQERWSAAADVTYDTVSYLHIEIHEYVESSEIRSKTSVHASAQ